MHEAPWTPPRLGPVDPGSPKYSLAAQYANMRVPTSTAPSQAQSVDPSVASSHSESQQLPPAANSQSQSQRASTRAASDASFRSGDQRGQRTGRTTRSSTPGSAPRAASNASNSDAGKQCSKASSKAGGGRPSSASSGTRVSDISSKQQLVRSASKLLQDQQLRSMRAQQSSQLKDPQALRYFARHKGMLYPEVRRYKQLFDQHESEGSIGKEQFERILYGCTASPQRTALPQSKVEELWQIANREDQFIGIDFQDFCTFYTGRIDECIGGLEYDGVGPARASFLRTAGDASVSNLS